MVNIELCSTLLFGIRGDQTMQFTRNVLLTKQKVEARTAYNLVGYWLNSGVCEAPSEVRSRLEDLCSRRGGHKLAFLECETGVPHNPMRVGLWNVLRRMVCCKCQPKRMCFGVMNLEDFLTQALGRCDCLTPQGLDGMVVANLRHISNDQLMTSQLILLLAERGKHVLNEDGLCVSCCHPTTKSMLEKKKALVSRAS